MSGRPTRGGVAPSNTSKPTETSVTSGNQNENQNENNNNADGRDIKINKRKLGGIDPSSIISEERSKRRRTPSPEVVSKLEVKAEDGEPKDPERAKVLGMQIYQKLMETKDDEGLFIAEPFVKLPSKRSLPDYYETIKHPMSLEMVKKKLDTSAYQSLKEVIADLGQIFNNAKRYNVKDSLIFQYAKKLHKITRTFHSKITSHAESESEGEGEGNRSVSLPRRPSVATSNRAISASVDVEDESGAGPSSVDGTAEGKKLRGSYMKDGPTVYKLVKPVMKSIREAKAAEEIVAIFESLPDRRDLPDYYQIIKTPISLSEIDERMIARKYDTWEEFFADVDLMCANAMTYNEDESEVFKDARQIQAILDWHRNDIRNRLTQPKRSIPPPRPVQMAPPPLPQSPSTFLPALPHGVVNESVVANLDRYPPYEQQAWVSTLPPLAMQIYRQLLAANEAKKRIAAGGTPPALAELPSVGRPDGRSTIPDRQAPPLPTIKSLEFGFSGVGDDADHRRSIRLYNMRGVLTHAVVVGPDTTEIELTAHIAPIPVKIGDTVAAIESVPEVSLRINGNQGNLPKFIFDGTEKDRPSAMKWNLSVPPARAETKIEVVATKPGAFAETSSIYVNRQF